MATLGALKYTDVFATTSVYADVVPAPNGYLLAYTQYRWVYGAGVVPVSNDGHDDNVPSYFTIATISLPTTAETATGCCNQEQDACLLAGPQARYPLSIALQTPTVDLQTFPSTLFSSEAGSRHLLPLAPLSISSAAVRGSDGILFFISSFVLLSEASSELLLSYSSCENTIVFRGFLHAGGCFTSQLLSLSSFAVIGSSILG